MGGIEIPDLTGIPGLTGLTGLTDLTDFDGFDGLDEEAGFADNYVSRRSSS